MRPLINSQGDVTGVIQIDTSDQRNRFSRDDLEVLASVACQAAIAVENAELHETAIRDQKRSRELEVAHDVLRGFLPQSPRGSRATSSSIFTSLPTSWAATITIIFLAWQAAGDGRGRRVGKGIPASLLMARLSADVRYCLASEPTPAEAIAQLNRVFFAAAGKTAS